MTRTKYFCEHCGREVNGRARICPFCGRFFSSVKCPRCGFSGDSEEFLDGCPACGYGVPKKVAIEDVAVKRGRTSPGLNDKLPTWVYLIALFALVIALALLFVFIK
jgi:hypothetical protein